jgi:hypothetical protein
MSTNKVCERINWDQSKNNIVDRILSGERTTCACRCIFKTFSDLFHLLIVCHSSLMLLMLFFVYRRRSTKHRRHREYTRRTSIVLTITTPSW